MPSCAVASCQNTHRTKISPLTNDPLRFHRIPKNEAISKLWIEACNRKDLVNPKTGVVCSDHFRFPDDYERNLKAELLGLSIAPKIKADAVPHLNLASSNCSRDKLMPTTSKTGGKNRFRKVKKGSISNEYFPTDSNSNSNSSSLNSKDNAEAPPPVVPSPEIPVAVVEPSAQISAKFSTTDKVDLSSPAVLIPDKSCCLICYSNCSIKSTFTNSWKRQRLLARHLNVIFIFRHLFELPISTLEKYLSCCSDLEKWVGICDTCNESLEKCEKLFNDLIDISCKFGNARRKIIETVKTSVVRSKRLVKSRITSITDESRQFVFDRKYDHRQLQNPFIEGDLIAQGLVDEAKGTKTFKTARIPKDSFKTKNGSRSRPKSSAPVTTASIVPNRTHSAFLNLFLNLKSKEPSESGASTINPPPVSIPGIQSSVTSEKSNDGFEEVTDAVDDCDEMHHFSDDNEHEPPMKEAEAVKKTKVRQNLPRALSPDVSMEQDDVHSPKFGIVELGDDDGDSWEVEDDNLNSDEDGEIQEEDLQRGSEIPEITCPLCDNFKCKVNKGEVLCQHLETCSSSKELKVKVEDGPEHAVLPLSCPVCHEFKASITDKVDFAEHIGICDKDKSELPAEIRSDYTSRIFECNVCPQRKFFRSNRFIIHYLHHKKMYRFECSKCCKRFDSIFSLHTHFYKKHLHSIKAFPKHLRYRKVARLPSIPWWCPICKKKFPNEELRQEHITTSHMDHSTNGDHKCSNSNCEKRFYSQSELKLHSATVHLSETRFSFCDVCFEVFQTPGALKIHRRQVHGKGFHSCTICHKKFNSKGILQRHLEHHKDESRITSSTCSTCNKVFSSKSTLQNHVASVHKKVIRFCCQLCGRPFFERTSFQRHMGNVHNVGSWKQRKFSCTVEGCGRQLRSKDDLAFHMTQHTGEPQFKCSYCGKDFYFPQKLKRHELQHTTKYEDYPFQCELCSRKYLRKDLLDKHLSMHRANTNYQPTYRKFKFPPANSKAKMKPKQERQLPQPEKKSLLCPICGVPCCGYRMLWQHKKEFHSEAIRTCPNCGKKFKNQAYRDQHVRIVHEKKVLRKTCEFCGKGFRLLQRHYQQMHKNEVLT